MSDTTGKVHVYTGDGKGKTTASLGLALRTLGIGGRVFYAQFIKGPRGSSEFEALKRFGDSFVHRAFGAGRFVKGAPSEEDVALAKAGLAEAAEAMASGKYALVVLDELNCAVSAGLLDAGEAAAAIAARHPSTEVAVTGRGVPAEIAEMADLISEVRKVKHYIDDGVKARRGVEF